MGLCEVSPLKWGARDAAHARGELLLPSKERISRGICRCQQTSFSNGLANPAQKSRMPVTLMARLRFLSCRIYTDINLVSLRVDRDPGIPRVKRRK